MVLPQSPFSPRSRFSYSPRAWRQAPPRQMPVREYRARAEEEKQEALAMRTAVYVGAGALAFVGVGALIYMVARK